MSLLKPALQYFGLVFGSGFVLGPPRIFLVVPRVGARTAELLELPIMVLIMFLAAKWVVRHNHLSPQSRVRAAVGSLALTFVLAAEFTLAAWLQGIPAGEYLRNRDPVAGTAYYLALLLFAAMPWLLRHSAAEIAPSPPSSGQKC